MPEKAIRDKLQGSAATHLRCGRDVNNQIQKGLLLSLSVNFFKSVNIWQSYKQEGGCFVHVLRLLAMWWPGTQSAQDNHLLARKFAKYSPILIFFTDRLSNKPFLN